jgi:hypothetical protein
MLCAVSSAIAVVMDARVNPNPPEREPAPRSVPAGSTVPTA